MDSLEALEKHIRLLNWWVNRFTIPGHDREDLEQIAKGAFCYAWDCSQEEAPERTRLSYAIRAAKHALLGCLQKSKALFRSGVVISLDQPIGPEGITMLDILPAEPVHGYDDRRGYLEHALNELSADDQKLITRVYMEEEPIASIADSMGLTRGAVYYRLRNLETRIRQELDLPVLLEMKAEGD